MGKPNSGSVSKAKGERKFQKKLQFYERVGETIAALNAQKTITKKKKLRSRQKKLKAYDLSSLSDCLTGLDAPKQRPPAAELNVNSKSWLKLVLREKEQLGTVLNHPAFKADPLGAIHQHLQSTQPVEEPKKKTNKNGSKKRKENKSKSSAGPSSMEI